jgi:phosphoserine phosphatase
LTSTELRDSAAKFIELVLVLRPNLAVFDCDGTLWSGDAGRDFFYWEIERGIVGPEVAKAMGERYRLYELGEVSEAAICGEMVTMNSGVSVDQLYAAGEKFFEEVISPRVFPQMQQLMRELADAGCEIWAVSSTNDWVVVAGASRFGIPRNRVLAACVHTNGGRATESLVRVPTDELKVTAIREVIGRPVDAVFGNSIHDHAMLEIAKYPFCINPNPDLEQIARSKNWPIYWPNGASLSLA